MLYQVSPCYPGKDRLFQVRPGYIKKKVVVRWGHFRFV